MIRVAFVMEQALGHITHARNLQRKIGADTGVESSWIPIEFRATGLGRRIPVYKSNWTVRAGLRARARLRRALRRAPADALFFHTQVPAVLCGSFMRRLPSVVSVDATPKQFDELGLAYGHGTGPAWLERAKFRLNQACFGRAAKIVAFSRWVEDSLKADYGVDGSVIEVVRPGLDVERVPDVDRRGRQGSRPLSVLFVGGDFDRKGGPTLLAAMDLLGDLDVELHVVTRATVEEAPRRWVHNGLSADSPALLDLYQQADVFCLPTRADALGLVFAEAGAAGLPLIGTDTGAVSEIVQDGVTGLVVPADDVPALAAALRTLLTDEDLRLRYGAAARALVRAEYDEDVTTGRIVELLHEVTEGRSVRGRRRRSLAGR